jgi:hypothetical protein
MRSIHLLMGVSNVPDFKKLVQGRMPTKNRELGKQPSMAPKYPKAIDAHIAWKALCLLRKPPFCVLLPLEDFHMSRRVLLIFNIPLQVKAKGAPIFSVLKHSCQKFKKRKMVWIENLGIYHQSCARQYQFLWYRLWAKGYGTCLSLLITSWTTIETLM